MIEITPENVESFLKERKWIDSGWMKAELLPGGVSNVVYRIQTFKGRYVLKQARSQLRTSDPWFSDLDRIYREIDVMVMLYSHLPDLSVPQVLYRDDENYAYLMTHAPKESEDWRSILLAGKIKPQLGDWAGTLLGKIHFVTYHNPDLIEKFRDKKVFDQLRIDPFYRRICERVPHIASCVQPLIEQLQSEAKALCHGDFSPKNLLLHSEGFMLVDYETAHAGDFTFDLGFFLSHLFLKAIYHPNRYSDFAFLLASFWRSYQNAFWFKPFEMMLGNAIGHLGACLLSRIEGTSPAAYLTSENQKNAARRIALELLQNHLIVWEQVMELLQKECQRLEGMQP